MMRREDNKRCDRVFRVVTVGSSDDRKGRERHSGLYLIRAA